MTVYEKYEREMKKLAQGICEYQWDELEELITDELEEENLSQEEFDALMRELMDIEP